MINKREQTISNLSYTNKDFDSIYSELLDLTKKLTNKWDPSISNESDPGVVLIKLGAILADKNNYNIDKNILELFPLSVTQYGNAQKIYELAGYSMRWYQAASTSIMFKYNGTEDLEGTDIVLDKYTTMVSNEDQTVVYTLVEDAVLSSLSRIVTVNALQGVIRDYEVNGVTTIKLDHLDSNNRIYFTDSMIAQNGIFISSSGGQFVNEWLQVKNLQTAALGQKIYKFGVSAETGDCYLEFPQDIASLIGPGLVIKYLVTQGSAGNVASGIINTLYSGDVTVTTPSKNTITVTESIACANTLAATDGEDYESLNNAYENYKRTIGTFDTLITCKDYESAASLSVDGEGNFYQSNGVVSDRTNDIYRSTFVVTLSNDATTTKQLVTTDTTGKEQITAFDLCLYSLAPVSSINDAYYYNKSFSVNPNVAELESELEQLKCVQHDWKHDENTRHIFKNFYRLVGNVSTYGKVSSNEAKDIENNIKNALYKTYNARNVNFGQEVDFDSLVSTIEGADDRIKHVMLNWPEYTLTCMEYNDAWGSLADAKPILESQELCTMLLAKMVLNGNVQLYNFDTRFAYKYGQLQTQTVDKIKTITTNAVIEATDFVDNSGSLVDGGYTLRGNENIQLYSTNFVTQLSYTAYCNFRLSERLLEEIISDNGTLHNITKNDIICLSGEYWIDINYVDSNDTVINLRLNNGKLVRLGLDSFAFTNNSFALNKGTFEGSDSPYRMLTAAEQIDVIGPNETIFDIDNGYKVLHCMWFLNSYEPEVIAEVATGKRTYTLFKNGQTEYVLQNNEYFIYTNEARDSLVILTSGTRLIRANESGTISYTTRLNSNSVVSSGISSVDRWFSWDTSNLGALTAQELQIVTLGEGAVFKCATTDGALTSDAVVVTGPMYKESAESTSFTKLPIVTGAENVDTNWYAISRLNLQLTPNTPVTLKTGQSIETDSGQKLIGTEDGISILSNISVDITGGDKVDVQALTEDGAIEAVLDLYAYKQSDDSVYYTYYNETTKKNENKNAEYSSGWYTLSGGITYTVQFNFKSGQKYILPVVNSDATNFTVKGASIVTNVDFDTSGDTASQATKCFIQLAPTEDISSITITVEGDDKVVLLGDIRKILIRSYKNDEGTDVTSIYDVQFEATCKKCGLQEEAVITKMQELSGNIVFDYTYTIDNLDRVDTDSLDTVDVNNVLAPRAVWDTNHICNKFTIPQLDVTNSSVVVARTSRSY